MKVLYITIILTCIVFLEATVNSQCTFIDGKKPPNGACKGPIERALVKLEQSLYTNGGCPPNQLIYYVDGNLDVKRCGQCIPGSSGIENPDQCAINEYCDDSAMCRKLEDHPLLYQSCPMDVSDDVQDVTTAQGWCGAGLKCINHVCRVCLDGVVDKDGKQCVNGEWSYSKWSGFRGFEDPVSTFIFWIFIVLVLFIIYRVIASSYIDIQLSFKKLKKHIKSSFKSNEKKKDYSMDDDKQTSSNDNSVDNKKQQENISTVTCRRNNNNNGDDGIEMSNISEGHRNN